VAPWSLGIRASLTFREAVAAAAAGRIAGGARVVAAVALVGHVLPFYPGGLFGVLTPRWRKIG
jgi:hypothetical protein